jgi:MFS transporter, DHA1 family, multidrug resistance protein
MSQSRGRRLNMFLLLGALSLFTPLSIDMYLPALPTMSHDLHTGASEVQLTLTTFLLGLAIGQLLVGPISDSTGRRPPLRFGIVAYGIASIACALTPSIYALIPLRGLQGFSGAAAVVIGRAIVRDLYSGVEAARYFSLLMVITGVAPILAPTIGGQLLRLTSWRGVFVVLACITVLIGIAVEAWLPETLPAERRRSGGLRDTARAFRELGSDRAFVGYCLGCGLAFATIFSYISGSSFVLQNVYGMSPQEFGLVFGINAVGFVGGTQINRALVLRIPITRLLTFGLIGSLVSGVAVLAITIAGGLSVGVILVPLFAVMCSLGFVIPNATALAMMRHANAAGSASALLGGVQMSAGAGVAPLVGVAGASAYPMAIALVTLSVLALGSVFLGRAGDTALSRRESPPLSADPAAGR